MSGVFDAEVFETLKSIDSTLKELLALSKSKRAAAPSNVATDADLDGTHGDPIVKFNPRDWTGDEFRQQPFSATTPEFLDLLAKAYDSFYAKKTAENDPKAKWEALTAARARGWALRLRNGWKPKTPSHVPASDITW
jgi:hypothetical protein